MLTAAPQSWMGWDFEIRDGGTLLASLCIPWFGRERGTLRIGGRTWELGRDGWYQGAFFLKQAGSIQASAEKPSALFRSFQVTFDAKEYGWEAESAFTRSFIFIEANRVLGSVRPESVFLRRARLDLPEDLSLERKGFLLWLALLMWRRQKNSG